MKLEHDDIKANMRIKLMGLWIIYILLTIYSSLNIFYQTGHINDIISGFIGSTAISQSILMFQDIFMIITLLPIFVISFLNNIKIIKLTNIVVGIICIVLKDVMGIIDDYSWVFNKVNGSIGIIIILSIIIISIKWKKEGSI